MVTVNCILRQVFLGCILLLKFSEAHSQCKQTYAWAKWENFVDNKATGSISINKKKVSVDIQANYPFSSTNSIINFGKFSKYNGYSTISNSTVPKMTWSVGAGGITTMCFSEPVTNPVLLIASLGSVNSRVALRFSEPYTVLYDSDHMIFTDTYSLTGSEGNAIILFPGIFTCLTISSETPENYTNITWGMQVPISSISITDTLKRCGSINLTASGGKSYIWNGGLNSTSATNTVTTSGIYSVTATDQNGCTTISLKDVPAIPRTILTSMVSKTICQGESFSGYNLSGTYIDSLKTAYGCDSIRTLHLSVLASPTIKLDNSKVICSGQTVELTPATTSTSLPFTYKWSTNETTPTILAKSAGLYSVTVVNGICSSVASTSVTVNPLPSVLPNETRTCDDNLLLAGGLDSNLSYVWEPSGETTPTITVHEPGTYKVKITNSLNCVAERTIQITGSCLTHVFAPDSFTPNQDLMNDTFKLIVTNGTQLGLTIYNRWGDILYAGDSPAPEWDGKFKGENCSTGTYGYKLRYKAVGSEEVLEHKGTLLLVR